MLGRLRLSIDKAIEAYGDFASKVFSDKKLPWQDGMFKASNLEKAIRAIIQDSIEDPDAGMFDPRPSSEVCKTHVHLPLLIATKLTVAQFCLRDARV
jgi:hypothetical protein